MNYFKTFRPLSPIREIRPYNEEQNVHISNLEKIIQKEKSEEILPLNQNIKKPLYSKMKDLIKT